MSTPDEIRAWARNQGYEVPSKGRIPQAIRDAHQAWLDTPLLAPEDFGIPDIEPEPAPEPLPVPCGMRHHYVRRLYVRPRIWLELHVRYGDRCVLISGHGGPHMSGWTTGRRTWNWRRPP